MLGEMTLSSFLRQSWLQEVAEKSNFFIAVVIVVSIGLLSLRLSLSVRGAKTRLPPNPPRLPILGNLHQFGTLPHRSLHALSKKYGPVMLLHLGQIPTVIISSEHAASEMMREHDIVFSNRPQTIAANNLFHDSKDVAFAPYGDYWRQMRRVCVLELLSIKRIQSFHYVREEEVSMLIEKISQECPKGVPINLSKLLLSLTNNISCRCILGRTCEEENGKASFAELTKKLSVHMTEFSFHDWFPLIRWMDTYTGLTARLKRTSQEIDAFIDQAIKEHKGQLYEYEESDKSDFTHILLKYQEEDMFNFDFTNDHLKAVLLDMVVGGTDTTFTTMDWALAELIKHPNTMRKVQEEVRSVVGTKSKIDENDLNQMEYLKCVVKETLRMHPVLPLSVPRETSSCVKIGNYDIPANTRVLVNIWAIQRDYRIWDRAEEFFPERFLSHAADSKVQDFRYIPFGGGRRGCPGINFGINITEYVLANILYWFNWKLPGDENGEELDISEAYGLTTSRKLSLDVVPIMYSP